MPNIEILAPVGSEEMLRAAVFSGADAVYLGFAGFNARTGAGNFDAGALAAAVAFCHARGVRVHVAMNTTVYGSELPALEQAVRAVAASGADAVICQDMATATMLAGIVPQLPRHASTQMSVHTLEGALQMKELGFARVILARELSLQEIGHITAHCGIETEVFIHGALCMGMSGQCYMSAFLGGRSGNRGSCAGPCRLPFDAAALPPGRPGSAPHLSLKDNCSIQHLAALQQLGVASAKIEGRLRPPEYVAAAVNACLAARAGGSFDRQLLQNVFSRSGFTDGYLQGRIDGGMFGARTEADAALTRKTLPALRELYRRERSRVPVDMLLQLEQEGAKLTVQDGEGNRAIAYSEAMPQPAQSPQQEGLRRSLAKTGGTPFAPGQIRVEMAGGPWYLPAGAVNELRRTALQTLQQKRAAPRPWPVQPWQLPALPRHTAPAQLRLWARFESWAQVPQQAMEDIWLASVPIARADEVPPAWRARVVLELPRAMFGALEEDTARRIRATSGLGFAGYEANNIAHLRMARGLPLYGGLGLALTNGLAAQFWAGQGLAGLLVSPEVRDSEMPAICPQNAAGRAVPTGALVYGHMPLMITRACPLHNLHSCAGCTHAGTLTDRKARKFAVRCGQGVRTVYNPVSLYMGDKPGALAVDYGVAYFTQESQAQAAAVLQALKAGAPFAGEFTRGLYFKGTA